MDKIAFLFPGQGAQYPGMGRKFALQYAVARQTYEEADDLLGRALSRTIFEGPEDRLTNTQNSQNGIFVTSVALLRVLTQLFPQLQPSFVAGLSLGEYTALYAGQYLPFASCLELVDRRGALMSQACEKNPGTMAVVIGLAGQEVEAMVRKLDVPNDLWCANFNCPNQVVLSGTARGIEIGVAAAKKRGAKRVLPLQVQGAFHSGLMDFARRELAPFIRKAPFIQGKAQIAMNVPGAIVADLRSIQENLIAQVTSPVCWEKSVRAIEQAGASVFVEIGCGQILTNMNKRIQVYAPSLSIETPDDLKSVESWIAKSAGALATARD